MSKIAKSGFITEDQVVYEFHNWHNSKHAKKWLEAMGYFKVKSVNANTTRSMGKNSKADVIVTIKDSNNIIIAIGISIKKFTANFNQIDKRKIDNYQPMWNIPNDVIIILKKYCGQEGYRPKDMNPTPTVIDERRFFLNELTRNEQNKILEFFENNKSLIIKDILKGNEKPYADYMLVIEKDNDAAIKRSAITKIENAIKHYNGLAKITKRGNLRFGKITVQRKGGNNGGVTAQMLQFKFSPKEVFDL